MICFINLFLVPIISTCFSKSELSDLSLNGLKIYAVLVILDLTITRVFIVCIRHFFYIEIVNDGVKYTVVAVLSAILIGLGMRFLKGYSEFKKSRSEIFGNDL